MVIEQKTVADVQWTKDEKEQLKAAASILLDAAKVLEKSDCDYYMGALNTTFYQQDLLVLHDKLMMLADVTSAGQDYHAPWS